MYLQKYLQKHLTGINIVCTFVITKQSNINYFKFKKMTTYNLTDINQNLKNNPTSIDVQLYYNFDNNENYQPTEGDFFEINGADIFDTEGSDEETSLMFDIRGLVACTIPELINAAKSFNSDLKIECVIDHTPQNGPEYYYKVDKNALDETLKNMFNTGNHNLYEHVHRDRITAFFITDGFEVIVKEEV